MNLVSTGLLAIWEDNMHGALDFCPEQGERNFMYQSYRVAMILLSNLYTVLKGNT